MPRLTYDPVYFQEGMRLESYCSFCQQRHEGIIFRSTFYWCLLFDNHCGREKILGYLMPPDEINRLGRALGQHTSQPPRQQILHDAVAQELAMKERWAIEEARSGRTRGKYI